MAQGALLLLLTAAVCLCPGPGLCSVDEQLQGKMDTQDGSQCVWFELRKSGRGSVFVTACHCRDEGGNRHSYSCEYDGPMDDCEEFRKSPKDFYEMVAVLLQSKYYVILQVNILRLCSINLCRKS